MGKGIGTICGGLLGSWVGLDDAGEEGVGVSVALVFAGLGGGGIWRGLLHPRGVSVLPLITGPVTGCLVLPAWCFAIQFRVCWCRAAAPGW